MENMLRPMQESLAVYQKKLEPIYIYIFFFLQEKYYVDIWGVGVLWCELNKQRLQIIERDKGQYTVYKLTFRLSGRSVARINLLFSL